jgi:hypothetical protein
MSPVLADPRQQYENNIRKVLGPDVPASIVDAIQKYVPPQQFEAKKMELQAALNKIKMYRGLSDFQNPTYGDYFADAFVNAPLKLAELIEISGGYTTDIVRLFNNTESLQLFKSKPDLFIQNIKNIIRNPYPTEKLVVLSNGEMLSFMMKDYKGFMEFMEKIQKDHANYLPPVLNVLKNDKIAEKVVEDPESALEKLNKIKEIAGDYAPKVFNELSQNKKMIKDFAKDPDKLIEKLNEIKNKDGIEGFKDLEKKYK